MHHYQRERLIKPTEKTFTAVGGKEMKSQDDSKVQTTGMDELTNLLAVTGRVLVQSSRQLSLNDAFAYLRRDLTAVQIRTAFLLLKTLVYNDTHSELRSRPDIPVAVRNAPAEEFLSDIILIQLQDPIWVCAAPSLAENPVHVGPLFRNYTSYSLMTKDVLSLIGDIFYSIPPNQHHALSFAHAYMLTDVADAFMRVLHAAVQKYRIANGIAPNAPFVHICTDTAAIRYDDPNNEPINYFTNQYLQSRPAVAVICKPAAQHYWAATNCGATLRKIHENEEWPAYYERVKPDNKEGEVGLITYDAFSEDDNGSFFSNLRVNRSEGANQFDRVGAAVVPLLLRWPVTVSQHNDAADELKLYSPDALYQPLPFAIKNFGNTERIIQQTNSTDCGPWACFLALGMTRYIISTWKQATNSHDMGNTPQEIQANMLRAMQVYCGQTPENNSLTNFRPINDIAVPGLPSASFFGLHIERNAKPEFKVLYTSRLRYAVLKTVMTGELIDFVTLEPIDFNKPRRT
jgi:hypothetical protein